MITLVINNENELKELVLANRNNITQINDVKFGELYPMIEVTNKHASYYCVETQGNKFLYSPFNVIIK